MTTYVYDLYAHNIVPAYEPPDDAHAEALSLGGGGGLTINQDSQPCAIGNYGDGPGAFTSYDGDGHCIFPPTLPDGATLTDLRYCATGNVLGEYIDVPPGDWDGEANPSVPAHYPFLYLDTSATGDILPLVEMPKLGDPGFVQSANMAGFTTLSGGLAYNRLWWTSKYPDTTPIHIQYLFIRATYVVDGEEPPPPEGTAITVITGSLDPARLEPRSDGLGTSSSRRIFPSPPSVQASPRILGGYT